MEASGRDRYDALVRHLQAGRELQLQPRRRSFGLDIHPSARVIVIGVLVVVALWFAAIFVTDQLRAGRVDTWDGPDATVQSGLRLAGCPDITFREDVYFPAWIRFEGRVFRWTERGVPIGPNSVGSSYFATGYTFGDLELFRVASTSEGVEEGQIMVRQGTSPVGAIFVLTDCG